MSVSSMMWTKYDAKNAQNSKLTVMAASSAQVWWLSTPQLVDVDRIAGPPRHRRILRLPHQRPVCSETALDLRAVDPSRTTTLSHAEGRDEKNRVCRRNSAHEAPVRVTPLIRQAVQQPVIDDQLESLADVGRFDVCHIRLKRNESKQQPPRPS